MAFTYFFRDLQTLNTAVRYLKAVLIRRSQGQVWDAGCAMGQEPYSLAILLAEAMNHFAYRNLKIYATDIDGSNLFREIIASGTYPTEELERIPRELFDKYFVPAQKPGHHQIVDIVRSRMEFQRQDLLQLKPPAEEISPGPVQKRAVAFSAARAGGSDEDVSSGTGARRLLRHRADPEAAERTGPLF